MKIFFQIIENKMQLIQCIAILANFVKICRSIILAKKREENNNINKINNS